MSGDGPIVVIVEWLLLPLPPLFSDNCPTVGIFPLMTKLLVQLFFPFKVDGTDSGVPILDTSILTGLQTVGGGEESISIGCPPFELLNLMTDVELLEFPVRGFVLEESVLPDSEAEEEGRRAEEEADEEAEEEAEEEADEGEGLLPVTPVTTVPPPPLLPVTGKGQVRADLRILIEVSKGTLAVLVATREEEQEEGGGRFKDPMTELELVAAAGVELPFTIKLPPFIELLPLETIFPFWLDVLLLALLELLLLFFLCFLYLTLYKL